MPGPEISGYKYCPSVTVIVAGHNEADTIASTMESVWSRYPRVQMIIVGDGFTEGMTAAAQAFAAGREQILVIRRGRKSSALNMGLHYATAEIVITLDADSALAT